MNVILKSIVSWKIIAPAFIAVTVIWLTVSCVILLSSVRTTGKVVQLVQNGSGDDVYFIPVFVFRDSSGIEYTNRSSSGSNPPRFPAGSTVSVLYRANNPGAGMIEDRVLMWVVPIAVIALGIACGSIGIVVDRWLKKKGTRNASQ